MQDSFLEWSKEPPEMSEGGEGGSYTGFSGSLWLARGFLDPHTADTAPTPDRSSPLMSGGSATRL